MKNSKRTNNGLRIADFLIFGLPLAAFFLAAQNCAARGPASGCFLLQDSAERNRHGEERLLSQLNGAPAEFNCFFENTVFLNLLQKKFFAPASVYIVNSTLDTSDAAPGDNVCND